VRLGQAEAPGSTRSDTLLSTASIERLVMYSGSSGASPFPFTFALEFTPTYPRRHATDPEQQEAPRLRVFP
jgi:hypothetical protein